MAKPTLLNGIETFLRKRQQESEYLLSKWTPDLETQINVYPGTNPTDEDGNRWTDGEETWMNLRWPANAGTNPVFHDRILTFSPGKHVSLVGTTWWDWKNRRSIGIGFDIDHKEGHAATTNTLDTSSIEEVIAKASELDYITVVRSKSGKGVHLYCFFDPSDLPETQNHHEHAAIAPAVLARMIQDTGFDFNQYIDVKGCLFWLWADQIGENGFELVKEASKPLTASELGEWKSVHLKNPNRTITIHGFTEDGEKVTEEADGGGYDFYPLEPAHIEILKELEHLGWSFSWRDDYHMAHTHTAALLELFNKRREEGRALKGIFNTVSGGRDKSKPNCFISPRPNGVFRVSRFGTGSSEHPTWETFEGKTWCFFNQEMPTKQVLTKFAQSIDQGGKMIFKAQDLENALNALAATLGPSYKRIQSPIHVALTKGGIFKARFGGQTDHEFEEWTKDNKGWTRELPVIHNRQAHVVSLLEEADKFARWVLNPEQEEIGWVHKTKEYGWVMGKTAGNAARVLERRFGRDAQMLVAEMLENPWKLVNQPFQQEYPSGGRIWNRNAPQLAMEPAEESGPHPHWDLIMEHLGRSLNSAVQKTPWCSAWGILTGADYLRFWIAAMIQSPDQPLPYLFFFGPQNSGKSIFHESVSMLMTPGSAVSANSAMTNSGGFNGELARAVLAFIEEKDLSKIKDLAYTRLKEWTMARTFDVHVKGQTIYTQPNTLHFVQMANSPLNCPLEDGDTRIVAIEVNKLSPENLIPKGLMERYLLEEAPYFLRTLKTTHIPVSHERTRLPVLDTAAKMDLERINQTPLEAFAYENLHDCPGGLVKLVDFYELYRQYCGENGIKPESHISVSRQLKNRSDVWTMGRYGKNQMYLANVSLDPNATPGEEFIATDKDTLVPVSEFESE